MLSTWMEVDLFTEYWKMDVQHPQNRVGVLSYTSLEWDMHHISIIIHKIIHHTHFTYIVFDTQLVTPLVHLCQFSTNPTTQTNTARPLPWAHPRRRRPMNGRPPPWRYARRGWLRSPVPALLKGWNLFFGFFRMIWDVFSPFPEGFWI